MNSELTADVRQTRKRFLELVADVRPQLHRYCARMAGSISDGEDIVQETLARAYFSLPEHEQMPPLRPWSICSDTMDAPPQAQNSRLSGWIFRIAHNCAIDHLRRMERNREATAELEAESAVANSPTPEDVVAHDDALRAALSHFMALPSRQRSCVILMDVLGHSLEEVASLLDMSVQAVKAALHRGRSALREQKAQPQPPRGPVSEQLNRYAQLFNARDWDGVRAMLDEDVRLDLVTQSQRSGRRQVGGYVDNYSRKTDWYFVPGWVEGRQVIGVFAGPQDRTLRYFIEIRFAGEQVADIRDYRYVPYIAQDAYFTL
ncbi:MAG TPA: sigma-70 family RNA polymerase sigma factor [Steroidobacteraceae bacterium]|jgi:RNA polymerase sigma-70 factor (ECF subfamily)